MDIDKFENSGIIPEKIKDIIKTAHDEHGKVAYRVIKHEQSLGLLESDFYPTFIQRNHGIAPDSEAQKKLKVEDFGMSVLETFSQLKDFLEAVPSLRKPPKFNACGYINSCKGCVSYPENNGHFQYFLYDPINNNPRCDFNICEEDEQ
ncbi:MAG: hypothetical protein K6E21_04000 [Bacilli bacterium]|nr:hypothetical protein [Bacilli bacterium]